ncbi:Hypothetical predicted protein [Podarcis lilfordi]|uniref:Uncharacterized protein n=1 Tax=Podarcis lilfordi TaxID=74358 RepID=A0AA35P0I6_9SAUR|nr:Hypothetical predicted protein [Podarcis lilfordi]
MAPKNQILLLAISAFLLLTSGDALLCMKGKTNVLTSVASERTACEVPSGPHACYTVQEFRGGTLSAIHRDCCFNCKPPVTSTFCDIEDEYPEQKVIFKINCCDHHDYCNIIGDGQ